MFKVSLAITPYLYIVQWLLQILHVWLPSAFDYLLVVAKMILIVVAECEVILISIRDILYLPDSSPLHVLSSV